MATWEHGILKEEQAGFRTNRSTQDVILRATDDWKRALDCGQIVATVMIDLSKAFDTINHNLLLKKLYAYGIHGSELSWFTDYLAERKMRVVVDGVSSEWARVPMGVPQGSILGPLLFLIFMNDLPEVVEECTINLYADDTTIYSADINPVMLGSRVEGYLGRVADWISSNGLRMNVAKTQLMVLSRRGRRDEANSIQVKVVNDEMKKKDCVRYLDVEIDRDLTWKAHIERMRRQCRQVGSNKKGWLLPAISGSCCTSHLYTPSSGLLLGGLEQLWGNYDRARGQNTKLCTQSDSTQATSHK